jgi:diadenosine tetraphosphate (Ap4A) HIT family hydrolase
MKTVARSQFVENCLFCEIGRRRESSGLPEDEIFARCETAYAKPALGQFIEGYSLIVPFAHERSLSCLASEELELIEKFKTEVCDLLGRVYGVPVKVFEHGCGQRGPGRAGSCIDHAHLHLVPAEVELRRVLGEQFPSRRLDGLAGLRAFEGLPFGYVYLEEEGERMVFELDRQVPSQLVRRLIAGLKSLGTSWDWRYYPHRERIEAFNATMASLRGR